MGRMRSISTVLGTLISVAALLTVMAAAAYIFESMVSTQANVARLTASRMKGGWGPYTTLHVIHSNGYVCFNSSEDPHLVRTVLVVEHGRIAAVRGECVPDAELDPSAEIVVATRSGALLPIDAERVLSVEGDAPLSALLAGAPATQQAVTAPSGATALLNELSLAMNASGGAPITLRLRFAVLRNLQLYEAPLISVAAGSASSIYQPPSNITSRLGNVELKPYALTLPGASFAKWAAELSSGWLSTFCGWTTNAHLLLFYAAQTDNNTVCGVVPATPYTLVVCVRRGVLPGPVTINGTLVWIGARLGKLLASLTMKYGSTLVYVGPAGGYLIHELASSGSYLNAYPLIRGETYKPIVEGNVLHFAPLLYNATPLATSITTPSLGLEPVGVAPMLLRPYSWLVWTPIAYYYTLLTGQKPWIVAAMPDPRIASMLYVEGFFTYVEPARGTSCRVIQVSNVLPPSTSGQLAYIPGLVCLKIGAYNATVTLVQHNLVTGASRFYTFRAPGDLVACYYPAVLECNGTVYIYYSFAPSTLYEDKYVYKLIDDFLSLDYLYTAYTWESNSFYAELAQRIEWIRQAIPLANPADAVNATRMLLEDRLGIYHYEATTTPPAEPAGTGIMYYSTYGETRTLYYRLVEPVEATLPGVRIYAIDTSVTIQRSWYSATYPVLEFNVTLPAG